MEAGGCGGRPRCPPEVPPHVHPQSGAAPQADPLTCTLSHRGITPTRVHAHRLSPHSYPPPQEGTPPAQVQPHGRPPTHLLTGRSPQGVPCAPHQGATLPPGRRGHVPPSTPACTAPLRGVRRAPKPDREPPRPRRAAGPRQLPRRPTAPPHACGDGRSQACSVPGQRDPLSPAMHLPSLISLG